MNPNHPILNPRRAGDKPWEAPEGYEDADPAIQALERCRSGWRPRSYGIDQPEPTIRAARAAMGVSKRMTFWKGTLARYVYLGPNGIARTPWACSTEERIEAILAVGEVP